MKSLLVITLLSVILGGTVYGATRGDVKVLEAADSIRYNVNKLTKDYLLYVIYPHKAALKKGLMDRFRALDENMHDIAVSTKDKKTKGVLKYFAFEKVRIGEILKAGPSVQNAIELIDFSESFNEGASAIARRHSYVPSPEEEMWIATRSLDLGIEEIIKYYVAHDVVKGDGEISKKLRTAQTRFATTLQKINQYDYKGDLMTTRKQINALWKTLEHYVDKADKLPLPLLATMMGDTLETSIDTLGVYHSKNQ